MNAFLAQTKHTPNVRKILQSQKTFANHLDDYQALLAHAENNPTSGSGAGNSQATRATGTPIPVAQPAASAKRGGGSQKTAATSSKAARKASTPATATTKAAAASQDVEMTDADATNATDSQQPRLAPPADDEASDRPTSYPADGTILPAYTGAAPPKSHTGDTDPLLVSRVPPFPTDDELRALMTAPPLSYLEARARFGDEDEDGAARYPVRQFCGVCGYWGRVRCTKCGARVCALDCLEVHRQECFTRYGI